MKKIKFVLTAILIVATVSGALAFKARKVMNGNLFCSTVPSPPTCPIKAFDGGSTPLFCTDDPDAPCETPLDVNINP